SGAPRERHPVPTRRSSELVFGPVVLVGAGGVQAEMWRDTAMELAPVSTTLAKTMLARLRSYPLLTGWRGTAATDIDAVARAVARSEEHTSELQSRFDLVCR